MKKKENSIKNRETETYPWDKIISHPTYKKYNGLACYPYSFYYWPRLGTDLLQQKKKNTLANISIVGHCLSFVE